MGYTVKLIFLSLYDVMIAIERVKVRVLQGDYNVPEEMNGKKRQIHDKDLENVEAALLRAAKRAREIAKQTHTPLVYYENECVVNLKNIGG